MEVMQPYRNSEVIPEVEGVQAFPPASEKSNERKKQNGTRRLSVEENLHRRDV